MRGTTRREDAAFWVMRLNQIDTPELQKGAAFLSRFTKDRNSKSEQVPLNWSFQTFDERIAISYEEGNALDVFRRWIEDGLNAASDIADEMGVTKGYISQLATRAIQGRMAPEKRAGIMSSLNSKRSTRFVYYFSRHQ